MENYQNVLSDFFHCLVVKFSVYLNRRVFEMPVALFCLELYVNNIFCQNVILAFLMTFIIRILFMYDPIMNNFKMSGTFECPSSLC